MRILVTGASGMVGTDLVSFLTTQGHEVIRLTRKPSRNSQEVQWNYETQKIDKAALENLDAVIHLAGESIAGGKWTAEKKEKIRDSRWRGTQFLSETLSKLQQPPKVLVCASAIGYYGDRGDEILTESSKPGHEFLADVVEGWEEACEPARQRGIRVANTRFGLILSGKGGALAQMLPPFQMGAGGILGNGKQYMSWIALDDVITGIYHVLQTEALSGPINFVSPESIQNSEFTKVLGHVIGRPTILPVPTFGLRLLFGEMADALLLSSSRVKPVKLQESGYVFQYPHLEDALRHVLGKDAEKHRPQGSSSMPAAG